MSASLLVLPVVWAYAERQRGAESQAGSLAAASAELAAQAGARKGPRALRVVRATAAPVLVMPARGTAAAPAAAPSAAPIAEVAFYRKYTEALLRRYMKLAMEAGRVPSLLGQEMFRGRVTSYRVRSFEDVVIFVHDVECCLKLLDAEEQQLLARIALQGHTQGEAARLLGLSLRTVVRRYAEAVDRLTRVFLERKILEVQG